MQSSSVLSLSPSFNNYSSGKLAEIAARVVEEFREESGSEFDDVFGFRGDDDKSYDRALEQPGVQEEEHGKNSEDDDFEFPSVFREPASAISADEIFYNGQIRPVFPLFKRDVLFADVENGNGKVDSSKPPAPSSIRLPLRQLFNEDRDPPSCSSSEAEDLDVVPAGTYCVWRPKDRATGAESPGRCKKSNSTGNSKGSSKRWKFRDLLHHSNSDGNDTFVFLSASSAKAKKEVDKAAEKETSTDKNSDQVKVAGKMKPKVVGGGEVVPVTAAHEAQCTRNRVAAKDGEKRPSFLPYRQDLVGLLANVNGLSRNLHPF